MQLVEVRSYRLFRAFLDVPKLVYALDEEYIPHIRTEIKKTLWTMPKGEVGLWLVRDNGAYIGRIAAFVNNGLGGFGFFESINHVEVAEILFEAGKTWLRDKSITEVEAPVNYGERDQFWGLMVSGFKEPSYQENYNPEYYRSLFEHWGFTQKFVQSTQEVNVSLFNIKKIGPLARRVFNNPDLEFRQLNKSQMADFADDFAQIYNAAWKQYDHFRPVDVEKVLTLMGAVKPILREDLIWFAYSKGKPVGFYISIVEVNPILKHLNGRSGLWSKINFLRLKRSIKLTKMRGLVFGVVPEYQGMGIAAGLMMKVFEVIVRDPHLTTSELAWIGDFNPKMLSLLRAVGAQETKRHITFEKKI